MERAAWHGKLTPQHYLTFINFNFNLRSCQVRTVLTHSHPRSPHGLLPTAPTRHSLSSKAVVFIHTLAGLIIPAAAVQDTHRPRAARARQSPNPPLAPTLHARPSLSRIATSWSQRGVTHHFIPKYLVCLPPLTLPFATPQHQRPALTTCYYPPAPCLRRQRS